MQQLAAQSEQAARAWEKLKQCVSDEQAEVTAEISGLDSTWKITGITEMNKEVAALAEALVELADEAQGDNPLEWDELLYHGVCVRLYPVQNRAVVELPVQVAVTRNVTRKVHKVPAWNELREEMLRRGVLTATFTVSGGHDEGWLSCVSMIAPDKATEKWAVERLDYFFFRNVQDENGEPAFEGDWELNFCTDQSVARLTLSFTELETCRVRFRIRSESGR